GHPLIVTYWRAAGSEVPQLRLVWHDGARWHTSQVGTRTMPFRLSGGGTKRIPISRPLVLAGRKSDVFVLYRDAERGDGITVARATDPAHERWSLATLLASPVGQWDPTHDAELWRRNRRLSLFVQRVG